MRRASSSTKYLLAAVLCALAGAVPAQAATERPIVYVIVIDGLDGDVVDAGQMPFIASMLAGQDARATYYQESRSVMITETNPNHTAAMSGSYAGSSGIPSNAFALYHPTENEDSCKATGPVDESKMPVEVSGENANCLEAEFVFEAIKRQGNPDNLLTAAIFGKPKLGRMFAGKNFSEERRDVDHIWAPCSSGEDDDDYCGDVPTNPVSGYAMDDASVMDEVIRTVREGIDAGEGKARRPDFTFVNLHQTDSAGHAFGRLTAGPYETTAGMADDEIERLVSELRMRDEWKRSVLVLMSDHSMDTTLTKTRMTQVFGDAGIPDDAYLAIGKSAVDLIYLADRTSPARFELLKNMRAAALATGNVTEALYREPNPQDGGAANTVEGAHPAWRLSGSERVPDLLLTHASGGSFSDPSESSQPLPGHHGAPTTRDNFFAVVGGGPFVRQQSLSGSQAPDFDDTMRNRRQAENVDPASTVMGLFGLDAPADDAGRFLSEAFTLSALPGRGQPAKPGLRVRRAGGGKGAGCRLRRYRVRLAPKGGTFNVRIVSGKRRRVLGEQTKRTRLSFRIQEGRRWKVVAKRRAASGSFSKPAVRRIDLRRAC